MRYSLAILAAGAALVAATIAVLALSGQSEARQRAGRLQRDLDVQKHLSSDLLTRVETASGNAKRESERAEAALAELHTARAEISDLRRLCAEAAAAAKAARLASTTDTHDAGEELEKSQPAPKEATDPHATDWTRIAAGDELVAFESFLVFREKRAPSTKLETVELMAGVIDQGERFEVRELDIPMFGTKWFYVVSQGHPLVRGWALAKTVKVRRE